MSDNLKAVIRAYIDLRGHTFGKLLVKELDMTKHKRGGAHWVCECECGNIHIAHSADLKSGNSRSCGCYRSEFLRSTKSTHAHRNHPLYNIWRGMKKRCNTPTNKDYNNYGARGIKLCDEWNADFSAFYEWAISNGYDEGLTLDRIDNDGNYEPSNCRWATQSQQQNNKRTNRILEHNGEAHTITEWAKIIGMNPISLHSRLRDGWSINDALTKPVRPRQAKK